MYKYIYMYMISYTLCMSQQWVFFMLNILFSSSISLGFTISSFSPTNTSSYNCKSYSFSPPHKITTHPFHQPAYIYVQTYNTMEIERGYPACVCVCVYFCAPYKRKSTNEKRGVGGLQNRVGKRGSKMKKKKQKSINYQFTFSLLLLLPQQQQSISSIYGYVYTYIVWSFILWKKREKFNAYIILQQHKTA